jgi:predicted nucleotidyltransferase
VNRLLDSGSEFRVHRQWFVDSAMDELLETEFAVAAKDRLYRCLDRVLEHKQELFVWLKQKWADLFHADFEVLLYDRCQDLATRKAAQASATAITTRRRECSSG